MKVFGTIIILALLIFNCFSPTGPPGIEGVPVENLVAVVAKFGNTRKIVLFDYYKPYNFTIVEKEYFDPTVLKFSHDKSKILANNWGIYSAHVGASLTLFSISEKKFILPLVNEYGEEIYGQKFLWKFDNSKFYSYQKGATGVTIYLYNIFDKKSVNLDFSPIIPLSNGNIIVLGRPKESSNNFATIYIIDENFNHLRNIFNGYLAAARIFPPPAIEKISKGSRYILDLDYFEELELFVYTKVEGYTLGKIAITDLEGTFEKILVDGSENGHPVFGPNGNTIIFERYIDKEYSKLMIVDIETGIVDEFVIPSNFGANSVYSPDY